MTDTQLSPDLAAAITDDDGAARSRRYRASTYDEAVVAATDELGSAIEVIEANRIRRGGLGGFFATDLGIEITVVPASGDGASGVAGDAGPIRPYLPEDLTPGQSDASEHDPGALPGQTLGMTDERLQQLLGRVDRGLAVGDDGRASFAELLADVTRHADTAEPATDPTTELPRVEAPAPAIEPEDDAPRLPSRHHRSVARSAPSGFAGATSACDRAAPFAEDPAVPFLAPFDAPLEEPFEDAAESIDEPFDWTGVITEPASDVTAIARLVTERITAELAAERASLPDEDPVAVVLPMDTTLEDHAESDIGPEPEPAPLPDHGPDDAPHPIAASATDPAIDVLTAAAEQLVRELGRVPVGVGSPLHDLDRLRVAVTTPDGNRVEMAVELGAGGD